MSPAAVLAPLLVQVGLTLVLLFWMGSSRVAAIRRRDVTTPKGSPRLHPWPGRVQQVSDAYHNQLELPVLFYVAILAALATGKANLPFVILSWAFVGTRLAHAFVHTGSNRVVVRFRWFGVGALLLAGMWGVLAMRLLLDL